MNNVFENLKSLKLDMIKKGWVIEAFSFRYKQQNYIVLAKLYGEKEIVPKYALIKLEFLKENDFSHSLVVDANSKKLLTKAKIIREYFGIEYCNNLGDILKQFNQNLARSMSSKVKETKTDNQKEAMCRSLSQSDSEDPRKKYCFSIRRNPRKKDGEIGRRSIFNDNKTRLYRPRLYEILGSDPNISFRFSTNPEAERSDEDIIAHMLENQE